MILSTQNITTGIDTPELFNSAVMLVLGFFFGKKLNQDQEDTEK